MILPFTILRRLDCILEPTRETVRDLAGKYEGGALDVRVRQKTGFRFYNTSEYDFAKLLADPEGLRSNLIDDVSRFSANIDVFERFKFENELATLDETGRLYLVVSKFAEVDLLSRNTRGIAVTTPGPLRAPPWHPVPLRATSPERQLAPRTDP